MTDSPGEPTAPDPPPEIPPAEPPPLVLPAAGLVDDAPIVRRVPRRRSKPPGPNFLQSVGWAVVLFGTQAMVAVFLMLVLRPLLAGRGEEAVLTAVAVAAAAATTTTLVVALSITAVLYGRDAWRAFAVRLPAARHAGLVLLLNVPLLFVVLTLLTWIVAGYQWLGILRGGGGGLDAISRAVGQSTSWSGLLAVAVFGGLVPAVGEELFFRGFLGRGLVAGLGRTAGVLVTSVLFGLIHLHPVQSLTAVVLGVVLHLVYLWTRSLVAPILLHAVHNWLVLFLSIAAQNGFAGVPARDSLPTALTIASFLAAGGVLFLLSRCRTVWERPNGSNWMPGYVTAESPPPDLGATPVCRPAGVGVVVGVAVLYAAFVGVLVW